jgi:uncharacterized protein YozE (UPF0346 family)
MSENANLRLEFEPKLISPFGLHLDSTRCKEAWDQESYPGGDLPAQIERATQWLTLWSKTKRINKEPGTSYGLKHRAEAWHHERSNRATYMSNGCFLMAAQRLGFQLKGNESRYCWHDPKWVWDCHNAWLNISTDCVEPHRKARREAAPFGRWLQRQKKRDDRIGDLARDAYDDSNFPWQVASLEALNGYLWEQGACDAALVTGDAAWREFKTQARQRRKMKNPAQV